MNQQAHMVAVVLAAGSSSRLGQPKQLIEIEGVPLLQRITTAFRGNESVRKIILVTGAHGDAIRERLEHLDTFDGVEWLENPGWCMGMGHSLAYAVANVEKRTPHIQHIILSVCDQPYLDSSTIRRLVDKSVRHPRHIIASAYSATVGPPVVFPRRYFHDLIGVSGKPGAKQVILQHMADVIPVSFPRGAADIDTLSDLQGI